MINLTLLKEFKSSLVNPEKDKENLIKYFEDLLSTLEEIKKEYISYTKLVKNLEDTARHIYDISIKIENEVRIYGDYPKTNKFKNFYEIRLELVRNALEILKSKTNINKLIINHNDELLLEYERISLLKADTKLNYYSNLLEKYNLITAESGYRYQDMKNLFYENYYFNIGYMEDLMNKISEMGLLEKIEDIYPTFKKDIDDSIIVLQAHIDNTNTLFREYKIISENILKIYKKYI